ncbi:hypothetical protein [Rhodococcus rhodochrous]|uniref:hypothetical protein n=1 Tax=Rhodococcus rhodochrous TaxID=1829 RepID=UPI001E2B58FB|nr:hypothetical protein [Rhodococcus rhodochrous]
MSVSTTTHLNLPGTAREALGFYGDVFGGEVDLTTYAQVGMPQDAPRRRPRSLRPRHRPLGLLDHGVRHPRSR